MRRVTELPQRVFAAAQRAAVTTRYFMDKLPVAVAGDPPVAHFAYLVTDTTGRGLEQFIRDHRRLFGWLPAWTVVAVGPSPVGLHACESTFQRLVIQATPAAQASTEDLTWYFQIRQTVDEGELAGLSVAAIDRYRTLREAFRGPVFDELYLEWRQRGDAAFPKHVTATTPAKRSVGTLVTELLPFDYSQFGSLPGVA